MWVDQDSRSSYSAPGGAIQAIVELTTTRDWEWKVGVLQNGRTEWSLGGASGTRTEAVTSAEAMIDLVKFALETGGVAPCGW
jgi:hypothetical protein